MTIKYTDSQKEAVFKRETNILVSAAAGSGKTRVLVDRIIHMIIEDEVDLQKMLIVTFTNAAASEMKTRIETALEEALESRPEKNKVISEAIEKLPLAHISTMHAFCIHTIRRYFHVLDISSNFKIISETNEAVLKDKAMENTLERLYTEGHSTYYDFVRAYGGHLSDEGIKEMIRTLANFLQGHPQASAWIEKATEHLKMTDPAKDIFITFYRALAINSLKNVQEALNHLAQIIENTELEPLLETVVADKAVCDEYVDYFNAAFEKDDMYLPEPIFPRQKSVRLPKDTPQEIHELRETFKDIRKNCITGPIHEIHQMLPEHNYQQVLSDRLAVLPHIDALFDLTRHYLKIYQQLKENDNTLDFNDVEHAMLTLLENDVTRQEIAKTTEYIFFDEYQDANPIQEAIINALAHEEKLFFVGDIKQAIYRFRLADPKLFHNRYQCYMQDKAQGKVIHLDQNFRSDQRILHFANRLFSELMTFDLGEVDYKEKGHALISGLDKTLERGQAVELVLLENNPEATVDEAVPLEAFDEEAYWIGKKIRELVDSDQFNYKDMVVLMRSPKREIHKYEQVFKHLNIPFFTDNTTVTFRNLEVSLFLSLLHVINNDKNDIHLLAVLLSPFAGFSEEDIASIRLADRENTFYKAFFHYSAKEDALAQKIEQFFAQLENWRSQLRRLPLGDFIRNLFTSTGYETFLLGLANGQEKYENVRALIQVIERYAETANDGLVGFLHYADTLIQDERDSLNPALAFSSEHDVVRIMSIHKSKGLEFPVVFLSNVKKKFNLRDIQNKLNLDTELGLGLEVVRLQEKYRYLSFEQNLIRWKKNIEMKSEEIRLLYVAVTRAIERLYIVSWDEKMEKLIQKTSYENLHAQKLKARSLFDWILSVTQSLLQKPLADIPLNTTAYVDDSFLVRRAFVSTEQDVLPTKKEALTPPDETIVSQVKERVFYEYPHQDDVKEPYKKTISEISLENRIEDRVSLPWQSDPAIYAKHPNAINLPLPVFIKKQQPLNAAEIGTAIHKVLEKLELKPWSIKELQNKLDQWRETGFLTHAERSVMNESKLYDFFHSELAQRIYQSSEVERERSFTMVEGKYLLDGQIDLFFKEDDGYIVVDFKTDRHMQADKYQIQLSLYAKALEKAFHLPVKECWIFWLHFGQASQLK